MYELFGSEFRSKISVLRTTTKQKKTHTKITHDNA